MAENGGQERLIVKLRESSTVRPAEETPKRRLWISDVDMWSRRYSLAVYFFRPNDSSKPVDANVLKKSLSKALVPFYPLAGRLSRDETDRIEINCNEEGALFVEADTDSCLDDICGSVSRAELRKLIPDVKDTYTGDVSFFHLFMVQVTRFKSGGVTVGTAVHHFVTDGYSGLHFINHWADIARLGCAELVVEPYIDRTALRPRDPPTPSYPHVELQPPPTPINVLPEQTGPLMASSFKLTREQLNLIKLKASSEENKSTRRPYTTTYEALAAHIWRCACIARDLPDEQESKIYLAVDGRSRFRPPLAPGFFANPIFRAATIAKSGDIVSRPLSYAAGEIKKTLEKMNEDYLRSYLDYVREKLVPNQGPMPGEGYPNLAVNSWARLPLYGADFGWGRPLLVAPAVDSNDGKCYVVPSPDDGDVSLAMTLLPQHIGRFEELLYDI
ncbi:shikimate O-hydroxycinnamoyltransferase-like [Aristolochia californica]|uniref:shikimate O-hydroxycinnamoyltransferase-like n=1 Tax=Aristolochia californica TaxID=171875 RepID=UPI0035D77C9E